MEEKENTENTGMGKRKHSHDTKIVIKYYQKLKYDSLKNKFKSFIVASRRKR